MDFVDADEFGEITDLRLAVAGEALIDLVERDGTLHPLPGGGPFNTAVALGRLGVTHLDERSVSTTLGTVLKYREDHQRVEQHGVADIIKQAFERGMRAG